MVVQRDCCYPRSVVVETSESVRLLIAVKRIPETHNLKHQGNLHFHVAFTSSTCSSLDVFTAISVNRLWAHPSIRAYSTRKSTHSNTNIVEMSSPPRNASPQQENRHPTVFSPKAPRSNHTSPISRPVADVSSPLDFNSPLPRSTNQGHLAMEAEFSSPVAMPRPTGSNAPGSAHLHRNMLPSTAKSSPMQFSSDILSDLATSRPDAGRARNGLFDNAVGSGLLSSTQSTPRPAYVLLF